MINLDIKEGKPVGKSKDAWKIESYVNQHGFIKFTRGFQLFGIKPGVYVHTIQFDKKLFIYHNSEGDGYKVSFDSENAASIHCSLVFKEMGIDISLSGQKGIKLEPEVATCEGVIGVLYDFSHYIKK